MVFIASMQNAMCSSRSTPISAAPLMMSSRLTERAKALSFIFFLTELGIHLRQRLVGLDQRGGGDESGKLVAGEQRFLQQALARNSAVAGVRQDRAANLFGHAALFQDLAALEGMVLGGGIFFVIEVVDEADEAPEFFVLAELAGVGAEAGFHRKSVFAKTF